MTCSECGKTLVQSEIKMCTECRRRLCKEENRTVTDPTLDTNKIYFVALWNNETFSMAEFYNPQFKSLPIEEQSEFIHKISNVAFAAVNRIFEAHNARVIEDMRKDLDGGFPPEIQ